VNALPFTSILSGVEHHWKSIVGVELELVLPNKRQEEEMQGKTIFLNCKLSIRKR
jgi:hypothetical protein